MTQRRTKPLYIVYFLESSPIQERVEINETHDAIEVAEVDVWLLRGKRSGEIRVGFNCAPDDIIDSCAAECNVRSLTWTTDSDGTMFYMHEQDLAALPNILAAFKKRGYPIIVINLE